MLTCTAPVDTPTTLDEALDLRARHPDAMPLAGGTDLMVFLELDAIDPPRVLNLWGLRGELAGVSERDGEVTIGALTTYTEIIGSPVAQKHLPTLVEASRTCGARQIQNRGTLGGNVANASPAGDSLPVLLALDAEIELRSAARGARRVPMAELYTGYRTLAMEPDELITHVHLPIPHPDDVTYFRKVGTRAAQSISKVVLGARLRITDGVVREARFGFGSVAPTPIRAYHLEKALTDQAIYLDAAGVLDHDIAPIDDVRSTAEYRRAAAERVVRGWLASLKG